MALKRTDDEAVLSPLTLPTARVDVLYHHLKEHILNQHWPPGAHLNISKLALELGVSITPIREALSRLTTDRLVLYESNQGFRIAPLPSVQRMRELGEMRVVLETHAAAAAATWRSEVDLDVLRSTQHDLQQLEARSPDQRVRPFAALNRLFHQRIVLASGNTVLVELYAQLGYHAVTGHVYQTHGIVGWAEMIAEHAAVIAALEAGDPEQARAAIRHHVETGHRRVMESYTRD